MNFITQRSASLWVIILLLFLLGLASCAGPAPAQPGFQTAESDPTRSSILQSSTSAEVIGTLTPAASLTSTSLWQTSAPTATVTLKPSPTAPQLALIEARSPMPAITTPIRADNLTRLAEVARWGKGSIKRVAFSPDGRSLLVSSPVGVGVYDMKDYKKPLQWLPFDTLVDFSDMQVSEDGSLVRLSWDEDYLNTGEDSLVFNLVDQKFQPWSRDTRWGYSQNNQTSWDLTVASPDNSLRFTGVVSNREDQPAIDTFEGTIVEQQTNKPLFHLKDEPIYIHHEDSNQPIGCDLESFAVCGNELNPNVMGAYRAAFSTDNRLLAVLYRVPNLGDSNQFSLLRVYSGQDGSLLDTFGSFEQPVEDFTFQPGTDLLAVAFVNGSVQVWDTAKRKMLYQAWNFDPAVLAYAFSGDGHYLLVQYSDAVKVLRTSDGAVLSRYEASSFALSPHENLLALGNPKGEIRVEDLDRQKTVSRMVGHKAIIYALAFSPDGQTLTSSSEDCTIRSWNAHTGQFQHYFEKVRAHGPGTIYSWTRIFVYNLRYIPGSDQLLGKGSWGEVASWNVQSGAKEYAVTSDLEFYEGLELPNDPHFPQSFWIGSDKSHFYVDRLVFNLQSGQLLGGYTPPENLPEGCSSEGPLSEDGEIRFTAGYDSLAGQVCVLSAQDQRLLYRIPVFSQMNGAAPDIYQIFLTPDGNRLFVTSRDGLVFVYQVMP